MTKLSKLRQSKFFNGGFWVLFSFGSQKALQLGSNLLLTRLLFPEAFGLMAIVNAFLVGMQMLSDVGIRPMIIQAKEAENAEFLNTAWTMQIARGLLLTLGTCLLAYPVSLSYGEPALFSLLCFASISATISGFNSISIILAERDINLKKLMLIGLASQALSIIAMASLAVWLQSVWALAIGTLFGQVCNTVLGHLLLKLHRHKLSFEKYHAKKIFSFGKWVFWSTLFTYFCGQGVRLIEGVFVSTNTLAMITIAGTFAWMAGELVVRYLGGVVFPSLCEINRTAPEQFAVRLTRMRLIAILATVPIFGVLSIAGNFIIELLYDQRYAAAGPILVILPIVGAFRTLPTVYQNALLAIGESKLTFISSGIIAVINVISMVAGYHLYGIIGLLAAPMLAYLGGHIATMIMVRQYGWISISTEFIFLLLVSVFAAISFLLNHQHLQSLHLL